MASKPTDFTILRLKELLESRELSTAGTKVELIARLNEHDPSGQWMKGTPEVELMQNHTPFLGFDCREDAERDARNSSELSRLAGGMEHLLRVVGRMAQELENLKSERAQAQDPGRGSDVADERSWPQTRRMHVSVKSVAELLGYFDGKSEDFPIWSRQLRVLKNTYDLSDDEAKILMGMRLRGKAQEWLQSRAEFVEMPFDTLLVEYRKMFFFRPSRSEALRQLQERTWKRGESFVDYYHDKMIRANRVPINDSYELIDHLVDGIPDQTLRNQAIMYCFSNPEAMLRAFEKLALPQPSQGSSFRGDRWRASPSTRTDGGRWRTNPPPRTEGDRSRVSPPTRTEEHWQGDWRAPRRDAGNCYNCGEMGHLSRNCPARDRGLRCYRCGEHGHIAPRCPQQSSGGTAGNENLVAQISGQMACKSGQIS
ncbi:uncharacterized protein LOC143363695 [Halictus rubicundus]|uniref:uncharacterized protein LOC143363695 n=1 Tax=Halictus rubicundus TaxID=77578 RepID=UPI004035944B